MRDNLIIKNIIEILRTGLDALDLENVKIKQNFQPRNQGADSGPTLYLHKIADHRYGYPQRSDIWDQDLQQEIHTETQIYESLFQITGLSIQNPARGSEELTASDITNYAAHIMQSDATVQALFEKGLSIYRVTDIRNPYFVDDKNRFEASPSFDFTIQHEQVIISTTPVFVEFDFNMVRV